MESGGFYITLPSNTSLDVYPSNTLTKYTVRLPRTLYMKEGYEVALAEIMYPVSWQTLVSDRDYVIGVINYISETIEDVCIPKLHYHSADELVRGINHTLKQYFESKNLDTRTAFLDLKGYSEIVTFKAKQGYGLQFSFEMHDILGFQRNVSLTHDFVEDKMYEIQAQIPCNPNKSFHAMYVYCNICKPQIVGDIYAPLLRTVAVKGKRNEPVTIIYNSPHYVPIGVREISEVEIDIRDDMGNKVPFTFGKVVCKLHFRKNEAIYS